MKKKAAVSSLLTLALILSCANPVKLGLQGLQTDVDSLAEKIEAGASLTERATELEREVTAQPTDEFIPKIEELKKEIAKVVMLEVNLTTIDDSLRVMNKSPRATEPLKRDISALRERVGELVGEIAVIKDADTKLDELVIKIEEAKEKAEKKAEKKTQSSRKKVEKKVY
ncbi:hypothetical protein CH333_08425 [candidate division WOR-3 bacterium JGI_Cruoil_03_44_89]|uniref:Uncharacterized protein n=1 Tax=candidate division WOR-3 bacterium JGI_Cruoil_03_44_89 TaxID=1973748 RepID=A0A235BPX4_UNCW3|nr:MAG: hypothetical protein CH333_08425 [candidate division WOR-3 bacterium JGI_Cruoil_03_44_89]